LTVKVSAGPMAAREPQTAVIAAPDLLVYTSGQMLEKCLKPATSCHFFKAPARSREGNRDDSSRFAA
jgi:hypothetical protein